MKLYLDFDRKAVFDDALGAAQRIEIGAVCVDFQNINSPQRATSDTSSSTVATRSVMRGVCDCAKRLA